LRKALTGSHKNEFFDGPIVLADDEGENDMTTLYKILNADTFGLAGSTAEEVYCNKVGVNSEGLAVVELKPGGKITAVPHANLEEVLPYTVSVKFNGSGTNYHYTTKKGSVEVGDLLFLNDTSGFAIVTAIGTKSKAATKALVGRKLASSAIESE